MSPEGIAVIIAASANAAGVIVAVGQLSQKLTDVRDDMREIRNAIQNCLALVILQGQRSAHQPGDSPRESDPAHGAG
jgi:glutamate dehydrogenase/leucine dehydrogenase